MKANFTRKRLWIDPGFQSRLLLRGGIHLVGCIFVVLHIAFLFELTVQVLQPGPRRPFVDSYLDFLHRHQFLLFGLVLLLPVILYDLLKFSHRIAGPLYRCRRTMDEMSLGKTVPEFVPRKNDLMAELFVAFNGLIRRWNAEIGKNANGNLNHADTKRTFEETNSARESPMVAQSPQLRDGSH